ncbi:MAG: hypothetical protein HQL59_12725, partial [Magnetococcales bacterium]|nr:hypothetical protein [Magnetococcales bacterium]
RRASDRFFGDLKMLPLFRELLRQRLPVTVYNPPIHDPAQWADLFADYLELARENPRFRFCQGLDIDKIIPRLNGGFHFGLMLYHYGSTLKVGKDHLAGALPSKLFVYLAAGLPILTSPELEQVAEFVEREGVGAVIAREDLPRLGKILAGVDYAALLVNVTRAQRRWGFEEVNAGTIDHLHDLVAASPPP